jgi:hypothetical protein
MRNSVRSADHRRSGATRATDRHGPATQWRLLREGRGARPGMIRRPTGRRARLTRRGPHHCGDTSRGRDRERRHRGAREGVADRTIVRMIGPRHRNLVRCVGPGGCNVRGRGVRRNVRQRPRPGSPDQENRGQQANGPGPHAVVDDHGTRHTPLYDLFTRRFRRPLDWSASADSANDKANSGPVKMHGRCRRPAVAVQGHAGGRLLTGGTYSCKAR